jgi:two-component system, LytTR family, response regulator LytT
MNQIRCIAIDDEPLALDIITGYIQQLSDLLLLDKFTNPVKAFNYLNSNTVDLIFVDIQMPDLTGLELVSKLENKPLIIFTTAYSEYAIDGFKVDAVDYLLKPVDFNEFQRAVAKARERILLQSNIQTQIKTNRDYLFIKSEYKLLRINFKDILYIQGMSEYVQIHLANKKPVMSLLSLKSLEVQLPENMFMRVHKSFIVNLEKIEAIERNEIVYDNGFTIPVGVQYKSKFQEFIDKNFM